MDRCSEQLRECRGRNTHECLGATSKTVAKLSDERLDSYVIRIVDL
jgi:hypothetical protein